MSGTEREVFCGKGCTSPLTFEAGYRMRRENAVLVPGIGVSIGTSE